MLPNRETSTNETPSLPLLTQLIIACGEYKNDYFLMKNKYNLFADIIIEFAMTIDKLEKFDFLQIGERETYKQQLTRDLILALRQYLRQAGDKKFIARVGKLIESNQATLLMAEESTDTIDVNAISNLVVVLDRLAKNPQAAAKIIREAIKLHLKNYVDLHPEKSLTISNLPAECVLHVFKFLTVQERFRFGLTSRDFFSLFNFEEVWVNRILSTGYLHANELKKLIRICQDEPQPARFLAGTLEKFNFLNDYRESLRREPYKLASKGNSFSKRFQFDDSDRDSSLPCCRHLSHLWNIVEADYKTAGQSGSTFFFKNKRVGVLRTRLNEDSQEILKLLCDYTLKYTVLFHLYYAAKKEDGYKSSKVMEEWEAIADEIFPTLAETKKILMAKIARDDAPQVSIPSSSK